MRLRGISGRDAIRALQRLGFAVDHQTGSHVILYRAEPRGRASVPLHDTLKAGTLSGLLRQAGIGRDEFLEALR